MLQFFKRLINRITANDYQQNIESYVASKHPKSTVEVEYWIQQYHYNRDRWFI